MHFSPQIRGSKEDKQTKIFTTLLTVHQNDKMLEILLCEHPSHFHAKEDYVERGQLLPR